MNSYDIAIFDILYAGQCDNLIRYLHNTATRPILVVTTQEQERYYANCQQILGIDKVFRKPITAEGYKIILNEIR